MKNRLEIQVIRKIIGIVLASVVLSGLTQFAQAAATQFNVSGTDLRTLQVTNATKYPYSNGNWGKTVYADPGDALDFIIFYHNSSIATALNTRLKINLPPLVSSGNSITANVFADNAVDANGAINVYLNYGSNLVLTFVPGSLKWYVGNPAVLKNIPLGQSGDEAATHSGGVRLGDVSPNDSGYVVLRAQIAGASQVSNGSQGSAPFITTNSYSSISSTSVTLTGSVVPNNSSTSGWFEYGPNQFLGLTTPAFQVGSGNLQTNYSANTSNLYPNTTYYYRAAAQNNYGISRGTILSFSTQPDQLFKSATVNSDLSKLSSSLSQLNASLSRIKMDSKAETDNQVKGELAVVHLSSDKKDLKAGDEINFTVEISPLATLTNASLQVKLPLQLDFGKTSSSNYTKSENLLTFNLGTVPVGSTQVLQIKAALKDDFKKEDIKDGKIVPTGILSYTDGMGKIKSPVTASVDLNVIPLGFLMSVFSAFSSPGSILGLIILVITSLLVIVVAKRLLN